MCLIPNTRCIIIAEHVKVSLFVIVFNLCKGNDIFLLHRKLVLFLGGIFLLFSDLSSLSVSDSLAIWL